MSKQETLYDISWQVSEPEYRLGEGISYSTLAKFNREGFDKLNSLYDKVESASLLFGSMVDTLLTDGQEEFDAKYLVAEYPNIPDSIISIVKALFREFGPTHRTLESIPNIEVIGFASQFNYQNNWKPETRAKIIKEKGEEYYKILFLAEDKIVVSTEEYQEAQKCVDILRTDEATKWYFADNNPFDTSIERFYQLKFKGVYNNIPIRCMMDLVIVDHTNKIIIPCDLKTSYKAEWNFFKSYIDWCYYVQSSLYWTILRQNLDKHPLYKNYHLTNYKFIVISKGTKTPLVWEDTDTQHPLRDRYYGKNKQIYCKDWRFLLEELNYYKQNNPVVPININRNGLNNIQEWLNNE